MSGVLPPEELPPLPDKAVGGVPGPYSLSDLRDVCGTRIAPGAIGWYIEREKVTSASCAAKTCAHPDLDFWLQDVGSLDPRARIRQPITSDWPMTAVIPRVDVSGGKLRFPLEPATYIIDYPVINQRAHELPQRPWVQNIGELFPDGSQLLLSFLGSRKLTLGLWSLDGFWQADFLDQFEAVILPDFAAFSNDPTFQYLLGERMQQIFGSEGTDNGRVVIPSIAWASESSLRRQVETWAAMGPERCNTVMLDCYGSGVNKTRWTWRWLMALEKYCAPHTHIRWLVAGITAGWAIGELIRIFPEGNFHIVSPMSMVVRATEGTADKDVQAVKFQRSVKVLEEFRSGQREAKPKPRPERWYSFAECRQD